MGNTPSNPRKKLGNTVLLLIDCQKSFHPGGSLAIETANADAERIAALIKEKGGEIDRIVCTLDSHYKLHIAHPSFWEDKDGKHPAPFTIIGSEDIESGLWLPRVDIKFSLIDKITDTNYLESLGVDKAEFDLKQYCIAYTKQLEKDDKFKLCIWPEHCLVATDGHCIVDTINDALQEWTEQTGTVVEYVFKGSNLLTESYSALKAEVPVNKETDFDQELMDSLIFKTSSLLIAGQAMSHCVNFTVRDIVSHWPQDSLKNLILIKDCASPVPGFEEAADTFIKDMQEAGIKISDSQALCRVD